MGYLPEVVHPPDRLMRRQLDLFTADPAAALFPGGRQGDQRPRLRKVGGVSQILLGNFCRPCGHLVAVVGREHQQVVAGRLVVWVVTLLQRLRHGG